MAISFPGPLAWLGGGAAFLAQPQARVKVLGTRLSVWENLDLGRVYRPNVLPTSVNILPYRPPARLIRAKYEEPLGQSDRWKLFVQL